MNLNQFQELINKKVVIHTSYPSKTKVIGILKGFEEDSEGFQKALIQKKNPLTKKTRILRIDSVWIKNIEENGVMT